MSNNNNTRRDLIKNTSIPHFLNIPESKDCQDKKQWPISTICLTTKQKVLPGKVEKLWREDLYA